MSVGNALIDADHRYLMCLVNTVELALRSSAERDLLSVALDQLHQYTHDHFEREQRLQLAVRYTHYDQHCQSHRSLMSRLGEIRAHVESAAAGEVPADELARLTDLLRRWLLDHVLKEDMLMKPILSQYPETHTG